VKVKKELIGRWKGKEKGEGRRKGYERVIEG
jgi:hypothetical protein